MHRKYDTVESNNLNLPPWKSEIQKLARTPFLSKLLGAYGNQPPLSLTAIYEQLRAMPRRARRALQRQLARSCQIRNFAEEKVQCQKRRALRHKLAWSVAGAALLLALGQEVQSADITVTTKNPHIVLGDGQCSLSEAIIAANTDSIYDACPAGSGADTIPLPSGTHTISSPLAPTFYALPPITSDIIVTGAGNGAKITRKKNVAPASLIVTSVSGNLTLNNVTLTGGTGYYVAGFYLGGAIFNNGSITIAQNSKITKNAAYAGGGVFNYGTLTVQNSKIEKNSANLGGGIFDAGYGHVISNSSISKNTAVYNGGGMANYSLNLAFSSISNSIITGNNGGNKFTYYSPVLGAGLFNAGYLKIQNSIISSNKMKSKLTPGYGGGLFNVGKAYAYYSTVEKNKADVGGGVYNTNGGYAYVGNSTVSQNQAKSKFFATTFGGGIYNAGYGLSSSTAVVVNSTISGNKADTGAGWENSFSAYAVSTNSTITKNIAKRYGGGIDNFYLATTSLARSLISGNKVPKSGYAPEVSNYSGTVVAYNYNLFGADGYSGTSNVAYGVPDIVPNAGVKSPQVLSPQLKNNGGPLTANGQPTKTHALVAGSPAIDAAPCVLGVDQRGSARPAGGSCDIGAFEGPP